MKLAYGRAATILNRGKSQSESAVTIRFRQLHIRNKTCILHSAVEYSARFLTIRQCRQWRALPLTLTSTFRDFPVNYPPKSMTGTSLAKRIDPFGV